MDNRQLAIRAAAGMTHVGKIHVGKIHVGKIHVGKTRARKGPRSLWFTMAIA